MRYPAHLLKLIETLKRFPGVGSRSAERFAFNLLNWKEEHLQDFSKTLQEIHIKLRHCESCGCLVGEEACAFCVSPRLESQLLCIVSTARDAICIESTKEYKGLYHVLGGLISPLDGMTPDKLRFKELLERIRIYNIQEVVIALDATLEGDATSLYLKQELEPHSLKLSRLAFGLPMGSSFDYVDGGTLARAFSGRGSF